MQTSARVFEVLEIGIIHSVQTQTLVIRLRGIFFPHNQNGYLPIFRVIVNMKGNIVVSVAFTVPENVNIYLTKIGIAVKSVKDCLD